MGDALAELRVLGGDVVEVHVEVVAGQAAEVDQVGLGDGASVGQQRLADLQVLEVAAERVHFGFNDLGAAHVLAGDRHQHARRALHRAALQVVLDRAQAAELLATAGAARAAVLELRQRRAVAGGFGRRFAVEDVQAAVQCGGGRHHLGGDARVPGDQAGDQAALAAGGQGDGFVEVVVAHQGADRAERLDVVGAALGVRVAAAQQGRGEERAVVDPLAARGEAVLRAEQQLAGLQQRLDALGDVGLLGVRGQRAHLHAFHRRIADHHLAQPLAQALGHGVEVFAGNDGAADRRALLPGLGGHLAGDFLDEQVEFFVVRGDFRGEDRAVQRVGFGVERNRVAHQVGVDAQLGGGVGRTGEGHHVLALQAVQQVAGAADDQLQAAFGQQAGFVHQAHGGFGQVAGGGGRFDDAGHAGEEARGELLQHAPDREVEGVDVHGQAAARHQDMGAGEGALLAQRHGRTFVDDVSRRQLAGADAGVAEQGAAAALDVDPAVGAGGAAVAGQGVELFLVLVEVERQGLEARRALLEVHGHEAGDTALAAMFDGFGEVQGFLVGAEEGAAVDGAAQCLGTMLADPAAADEALQRGGVTHEEFSVRGRRRAPAFILGS
ncbi:hypothetical protein D9M70_410230 [compost metagenome]